MASPYDQPTVEGLWCSASKWARNNVEKMASPYEHGSDWKPGQLVFTQRSCAGYIEGSHLFNIQPGERGVFLGHCENPWYMTCAFEGGYIATVFCKDLEAFPMNGEGV
jgi:hypothetical protein